MDKFKVGQRVKIITKDTWAHGLTGVITGIKTKMTGEFMGHLVTFDDATKNIHGDMIFWENEELALEPQQTMTLKEAMKLCIDGAKVCFEGSQSPKNHMAFDGKNFVYFEDGEYTVANMVLHREQWKLWTEPPTPPRFKPRQLIRNATGDIGFVVSDEGVKKGVRRYKVCFNALEDSPLKNYDEPMIFGFEL